MRLRLRRMSNVDEAAVAAFGSGNESGSNADDIDPETPSDTVSVGSGETQDGVRIMEAVSMVWSKWGLAFAYFSVFLMSFATSLEGQVTLPLSAFAVSAFKTHSLISTVYVVQGIVNAVIKPPMAKVADVFGRLEAFSISLSFCVLGYIQMALSHNVQTYASAQIFYSAGSTGLQILQQIFIADTSNLLNRALFSSLPDTPFLVTVWVGSAIASAILRVASWRWGYAMWAFILPVTFLPLALSLFLNRRKAQKFGLITKSHDAHGYSSGLAAVRKLFRDLDIVGILILSAAFAFILLPLTLASRVEDAWHNPIILGFIVFGAVLLVGFFMWESQEHLAPHPLIPLELLKSRAFCVGCGTGFFYFMVFYLSIQPYFYSYLLIVHNQTVSTAGRITQTFSFTATVANILNSLLIQRFARYKPFLVAGAGVYLLATFVMFQSRTEGASIPMLVAAQAALGVGASLLHLPAQLAVQSSVATHQQVGAATAVFMTLVEIGGAVGAAVSGAVWSSTVPAKLEAYLPESAQSDAHEIYASVVRACSYAWGSPERVAINRAYQETMTTLLGIACCMCLPLLLLTALAPDVRLDRVDQNVRGRVIGGDVAPAGTASSGKERKVELCRRWQRFGQVWRRRIRGMEASVGERRELLGRRDA